MKRLLIAVGILAALVALGGAPAHPATASPDVTISLLNPVQGGLLEMEVGEAYTFNIEVTSDEPFIIAMAQTDSYYPGRGVVWHGCDRAMHSTSAELHLTVTAKGTTSYLQPVCGWPEAEVCWPEGVAPLAIVVGVRYPRGELVVEWFLFAVKVP